MSNRQRQSRRHHIRQQQQQQEVQDARQRRVTSENTRLRLLLTSALDLAASHYTEIRNLREDLERLSSLPVELNNWYTKYARLRDTCLQLRGHMAYLRRMHAHDIEVLENQVEQLQEAWRFLDDQLLERSREFNFITHRWNPFDRY